VAAAALAAAPAPAPAAHFSAEEMQLGKSTLKRSASVPIQPQPKRVNTGGNSALFQHLEQSALVRRGKIEGNDDDSDESQNFKSC
jgi:hypothetical protein